MSTGQCDNDCGYANPLLIGDAGLQLRKPEPVSDEREGQTEKGLVVCLNLLQVIFAGRRCRFDRLVVPIDQAQVSVVGLQVSVGFSQSVDCFDLGLNLAIVAADGLSAAINWMKVFQLAAVACLRRVSSSLTYGKSLSIG